MKLSISWAAPVADSLDIAAVAHVKVKLETFLHQFDFSVVRAVFFKTLQWASEKPKIVIQSFAITDTCRNRIQKSSSKTKENKFYFKYFFVV